MGETDCYECNVGVTLESWCVDALVNHAGGSTDCSGDLSNLTIVVPSRNRHDYLLRQLRYWSSSSAHLVIVDGSKSPLSDQIRSAVETHPSITYRHEASSFAERLSVAGTLIKTPYAVMLGDDEFHLPSGLRAAVGVLEENRDLVGCMGQVLSFSPVDSYRRVVLARAYRSLSGYTVQCTSPPDRLFEGMADYAMATCYAVLRSPVWKCSWGSIGDWGSGHAAEIQQAMAVFLLGDLSTTNCVQWLRSIENPNAPFSPAEEKRGKIWFPEWWEDQRYEPEHVAFVSRLAGIVADELGVDHDECASWTMIGAEVFVKDNRWLYEVGEPSQGLLARLIPAAAETLRVLARRFPDPLFLGVKRWRGYVQRLLRHRGGDYYGTVEDLPQIFNEEGLAVTPEVIAEIASIEVLVREFHELRRQEQAGA